jgi:oligopeptidase B
MGRPWYKGGKLLKKMNTFTDFIDGTEHLIREQYCDPKRIYANGASAGGLLMGAIVNLRPDLYRGINAGVPFVDVLTTMLDDSIPLTTGEYDEWGNPHKEEYYKYMAQYSPYDNVKAQAYPSMLITAGFHDSQVQYWEPAKWAAKLRKLSTSGNPVLLYTEMEAGHGGASGRFHALDQTALEYAFYLQVDGQKE